MKRIRVEEAANYLGLSESTLNKLRCYGGGPVYLKLGRSVFYRTTDLDMWISEQERSSTWAPANKNVEASKSAA